MKGKQMRDWKEINQARKKAAHVYNVDWFNITIDDRVIVLEVQITSYGSSDSWFEPGDPPEWVVWDAYDEETEEHFDISSDLVQRAEQIFAEDGSNFIPPEPVEDWRDYD